MRMISDSGEPSGRWEVVEVRAGRRAVIRRVATRAIELLRTLPIRLRLGAVGRGTRIAPPISTYGDCSIRLGQRVSIWSNARLVALNAERGVARIEIGAGAVIHPYAHIAAIRSVRIGEGALFASHVYVSDHDHDWRNPDDPPVSNGRVLAAPVSIGAHVWLGERVCVLRGVTIGEGSIVGAGSIVTRDIPARSIAVGAPAKVIRRWDYAMRCWVVPGHGCDTQEAQP